ncbi:protein of unknown function [Nitrospina watsonii]|uniref:Uncharacterized protein n=1 Tax=Nitrospina watsonii TaxID=1323948 RepID=A0ABN8W496_9BACT|nr:protein of unknown function [Nitrospina watsonii]
MPMTASKATPSLIIPSSFLNLHLEFEVAAPPLWFGLMRVLLRMPYKLLRKYLISVRDGLALI